MRALIKMLAATVVLAMSTGAAFAFMGKSYVSWLYACNGGRYQTHAGAWGGDFDLYPGYDGDDRRTTNCPNKVH